MSSSPPLIISHVAATPKRYPGEVVRLHTRVTVLADVTGFTLTITIPRTLVLTTYRAEWDGGIGSLEFADGGQVVRWRERNALTPGRCLDYLIEGAIDADQLVWHLPDQSPVDILSDYDATDAPTVRQDRLFLASKASVTYSADDKEESPAQMLDDQFQDETTYVTVIAKGHYLQYLPALYEQDDFMGRFLMLFESFWGPLEAQLAQVHHLFDPRLAPATLLPWLASWYDLELPTGWSEVQKRAIVAQVLRLYRRQGACAGLQEYIEYFSGGKVTITEYAASSFRIGRDAQLGSGLAFGSANRPHTFAVHITAPRITSRCEGSLSERERNTRLAQLTELIAALIDAEKPAHTVCTALTIT